MQQSEQQQAEGKTRAAERRFGDFFCSMQPNGMIGCIEFLLLTVAGWLASGAALALLLLIWGGGVLAAAIPAVAYPEYYAGPGLLPWGFSIAAGLCLLSGFVLLAFYHARLLQLRMIDIGLSRVSVPAVAGRFWWCFAAALIASLFSPAALVLFVFCCVCRGKTYDDNRDLFAPIAAVPPPAALARQMHERGGQGEG